MRGAHMCDAVGLFKRVTVPPQPPLSPENPAGKERNESKGTAG
jgi:hypothetical protein